MQDPDPKDPLFAKSNYPPSDPTVKDVYAESPYRPRMRTAPLVNRAYRQDEFPSTESRLPRDKDGKILPPVSFTPDGKRIERHWPGPPLRGFSGTDKSINKLRKPTKSEVTHKTSLVK